LEFNTIIGIAGFALMLTMVLLGVPVFVAMLIPALAGFWLIGGPNFALEQFTQGPYNLSADFSWTVLPMFMLMGVLAAESGIAEGCLNTVAKWVPRLRGSLLMTLIVANAIFGAVNGSPAASNAVFTKIALPQINKLKYDRNLSLATIASAGVLSSLIPPSTIMIILCILTDTSIGKALVAGIIPGIVTTIVFCLVIFIEGLRHPNQLPMPEVTNISLKERLSSLKYLLPVVVLFLLLIGGIYAGIYPPSVGGAIGAFGVLIYCFIVRLSKKKITGSFWDSVLINAQVFPMVIAGMIFARFVSLSGLTDAFSDAIVSINMPAFAVMAIIMVFYIIMGVVAEVMPILIVTLPIVFPLLMQLGYNPYVLCIVIIYMVAVGGLSPPLGLPVFTVASLAKVPPMAVFSRVWPFFWAMVILCWIIIFFPALASWLPDLFFN
jgi:C4-dicarboxylate transporter, DctM subunit